MTETLHLSPNIEASLADHSVRRSDRAIVRGRPASDLKDLAENPALPTKALDHGLDEGCCLGLDQADDRDGSSGRREYRR